jgi:hypothetical protein
MRTDLETLIRSSYPIILLRTWEEERAVHEVRRIAHELKVPLLCWSVTRGLHLDGSATSIYNTEKPAGMLAHISCAGIDAIYFLEDFHPYLEDPLVVRMIRDLVHGSQRVNATLVFCGPEFNIPRSLEKDVIQYAFQPPTRGELNKLLYNRYQEANKARKVRLDLTRREWNTLVSHLDGLTFREAERIANLLLCDNCLNREDIQTVIRQKQALVERSGVLELVATPTSMNDIGGLHHLKEWLHTRALAFSSRAGELGLQPPKGILLLGVQGCGKSLCAKAIATAWGMSLARFNPASLYDKFIGESEKNLQKAIEQAELLAPVVLWIDEIEKALETGSDAGADGGLSRRLLGMLLSWMQERTKPVFVAATCNDIAKMPPELLRKGRFDEIFFVDLPDVGTRREIFQIHLVKRKQNPAAFDVERLAESAEGFSGAEIEQVVIDALYEVLAGKTLNTDLLLNRIASTQPLSVVMAEKVGALRRWAKGRTVPAD